MSPKIRIGNNHVHLPRSRAIRVMIGLLLILGGLVGFLPVLGFWMIPLGVLVLSIDLPMLRRLRRRLQIWWGRRHQGQNAGQAKAPERAGDGDEAPG